MVGGFWYKFCLRAQHLQFTHLYQFSVSPCPSLAYGLGIYTRIMNTLSLPTTWSQMRAKALRFFFARASFPNETFPMTHMVSVGIVEEIRPQASDVDHLLPISFML